MIGARNATFSAGSAYVMYGQAPLVADTTPPVIVATRTPSANANGWNNGAVSVMFSCDDSESGIRSCTPAVALTSEGAGQSVTGTAVDNAGNSTTATVDGIAIDLTPPSVTLTGVVAGATYRRPPTPRCATTDALSGVATPAVRTVVKSDGPKHLTTYSVTCAGASDMADNVSAPVNVTYRVKSRR